MSENLGRSMNAILVLLAALGAATSLELTSLPRGCSSQGPHRAVLSGRRAFGVSLCGWHVFGVPTV